MKNFFEQANYTFEDIQSLISNEAEESIYLEFKESRSLDKSDPKKNDIAKDISSFANSDGGIIIYGIGEQDHKARTLSFIDGDIYTKEWMEQVINSGIQRRITDLQIFPLRGDGDISKTIYVIKIQKSFDAPHLSKDKRFYKRSNFMSIPMEEYEIRQLYGRKVRSKLTIYNWYSQIKIEEDFENISLTISVLISNDGDICEELYKLNVILDNYNEHLNLTWSTLQQKSDYTVLENNRVKISTKGEMAIFPLETVTASRFNIKIPLVNVVEALRDLKIEIRLYYSNGEELLEGSFTKILADVQEKLESKINTSKSKGSGHSPV
jgi:hypothetical protein